MSFRLKLITDYISYKTCESKKSFKYEAFNPLYFYDGKINVMIIRNSKWLAVGKNPCKIYVHMSSSYNYLVIKFISNG